MPGRVRDYICRHSGRLRGVAVLLLLAAGFLLVRTLPVSRPVEWLRDRVGELGPWGPALFALGYVLLTAVLLPGTPITVAAGAVFGPVAAVALVLVAATASAALSFVLARYVAHDRVARLVGRYPRVRAVYRALGRAGAWKIVAAIRLSHAMPFGLQNFLFGLTPIRFGPYLLASAAAMLPGTVLWVYLGYLGGAALQPGAAADGDGGGVSPWLTHGFALVAGAAALLYLIHVARHALTEATGVDFEHAPPPPANPAGRPCWPWATLALLGVALAALAVAAWGYAERDRVQETVTQWFTASVP